jgi:serine/threonine protein kinase
VVFQQGGWAAQGIAKAYGLFPTLHVWCGLLLQPLAALSRAGGVAVQCSLRPPHLLLQAPRRASPSLRPLLAPNPAGPSACIPSLGIPPPCRPSVLEEFRREVAVLASLAHHPNIVRLVGACTALPNLAVVTEYCRG